MKRFFAQLKKLNVRRAVLSKTAARVFVGVIACLLWDRFLNSAGRLSVLGHAFMAVGLLFAAFAWMHYLSLDGFKLFYHFQRAGTALPSMFPKGICIHSSTEGRMSVMHIFGICWGATSCP